MNWTGQSLWVLRAIRLLWGCLFTVGGLSGCVNIVSMPPLVSVSAPESILISNVSVFDGVSGNPVRLNQDVRVSDGVIQAVVPHGAAENATEAEGQVTIDGRGMTLMPGLIDFHVHLGGTEAPPWKPAFYSPEHTVASFLSFGVTSVVDMGGAPVLLDYLKSSVESGDMSGPRIFYAGRQLTAVQGHPVPLIQKSLSWPVNGLVKSVMVDEVDSDTDLDELISIKKQEGAALVKVMIDRIPLQAPVLTETQVRDIVKAAHKQGLPVAAHIGTEQDLLMALDAGVDVIAHSVNQSSLSPAVLQRMQQSGAFQVSTLRVFRNIATVERGRSPVESLDKLVMHESVIDSFASQGEVDGDMRQYAQQLLTYQDDMFRGCQSVRQQHIPVLMGTDSPLFGSPGGSSAIAELLLLVEKCGYSPAEALEAATSQPGAVLSDWQDGLTVGVIKVGAAADMLLVEGRPDQNIQDLKNLKFVVSRGSLVQPSLVSK